jgi:glycosyltransferase involved in cell wall biosynthesis
MGGILIAGSRGYPANYGGFETLAQNLADQWSEQHFHIFVTGFSTSHTNPIEITSHKGGLIKTVKVNLPVWSRLKNLVCTFVAVVYTVRKFDIDDALVLNDVNLLSALFLKVCKIRTVIHLDGDESARRGLPKVGRFVHSVFRKVAFRHLDNLVVDSMALLRNVPRNSKGRVHVVKYGVNPKDIYKEKIPLDVEWIKDNYILVVARFVPENNIQEILGAYLSSSCKVPLVIIGKGTGGHKYEKEIERLAHIREGKVFVVSAIYDSKLIHSLLANSALYVHGHEAGGTNPILISARFFAKNIAAHDNVYNQEGSGLKETFWNSTSQLVQIFNQLDGQVEIADENPRREIGIESWESISLQYLELIKESRP